MTGEELAIRGLWFNQSEIYALLTMHRLASSMQPGLIAEQTQTLVARITQLLGTADDDPQAILSYIEIVQSATRRRPSRWFETVARATVRRRRLKVIYYTRSRDRTRERQLSPQRLLHYRENWYLLAWCHSVDDLRLFALDAMRAVTAERQRARKLSQSRLEAAIGGAHFHHRYAAVQLAKGPSVIAGRLEERRHQNLVAAHEFTLLLAPVEQGPLRY